MLILKTFNNQYLNIGEYSNKLFQLNQSEMLSKLNHKNISIFILLQSGNACTAIASVITYAFLDAGKSSST